MDLSSEIPFKVYTFWKEGEKPEVRRFGAFKGAARSFVYLTEKLLEFYPGLKDKTYSINWKDEDGDDVVISTDQELMIALQSQGYESLKVYVYCKGEQKKEDCNIFITSTSIPGCSSKIPAGNAGVPNMGLHFGVVCDSCDNPVVGFRYKCTVCDDFDLCSQCESAGCHPEHCMVRVPTPHMPRTLIKAAIKRSRHFLKSVATNIGEECPYTKRRRDRSGDRKHRPHHGPHGPHHGGDHHRRPRSSWLETFATYMNEFANLAGDIDLGDDKPKAPEASSTQPPTHPPTQAPTQPPTQAPTQQPQPTQEQAKTATESSEAPKQPEPNTSANAQTQCPYMPAAVNAENLRGLLQMFLQDMQVIPQQTPPQSNDVEMGQGDRRAPEADNATATSETSAKSVASAKSMASAKSASSSGSSLNTDFFKDASPDKADDWTMIMKEKDLLDAAATVNETASPLDFDLTEEFRNSVRVTAASIYPPLNASTAVLNPKEPVVRPMVPATAPEPEGAGATPLQEKPAPAAQPQPQQQPQAQPKTAPRQRHPKLHIDAAIQQMLAMGFTNDGGWLTQLLESKDGNIAAVLDLLTPVNPKK